MCQAISFNVKLFPAKTSQEEANTPQTPRLTAGDTDMCKGTAAFLPGESQSPGLSIR